VLCANGAETPRLLLLSASAQFPQGLANGSGMVGRHLMFNGSAFAGGRFDQRVNGYRGTVDTRVIQDLYELDPALGLVGGGGFDFRFDTQPIAFALWGLTGSGAQWGGEFKRKLRDYFNRTAYVLAHTSSLPVPTNTITLDPTVKDDWGLAALRMTFQIHPNDQRLSEYFLARVMELLQAAGATDRWAFPAGPGPFPQVHLLGTCRMGNDPRTSVVDRMHRAHDVPNLFIVDGSSFVTSGRGQPTMTIQALAFRAAENMARMAKAGGLGQ
jgi:choline dehydrogenase-like flavoprotein